MQLGDITVEVRTNGLARVGAIRPEDLDLQIEDDFNNVGTWTLNLAVEHPLAAQLRTPGSGIIVTGPSDVLISGPVTNIKTEATATDPTGTLTISGVTDSVLLADSLAYADPLSYAEGVDLGLLATADTRTGPVETLMHQFVTVNIGPGAPAARRSGLLAKITMGANGGRGATTTKTAAYTVLGTLLAELASTANLGFRLVQRGTNLVFETYPVTDRTATIRLDIANSTLAGSKVIVAPPSATRVLVAGESTSDDGLATSRAFVVSTTTDSLGAETEWGRRIEVYKDNSSVADEAELEQTGQEELADKGLTSLSVQAVPMDDSAVPYGTTWSIGDKVAVVVEDQELSATVSGYLLKANADGFRLGALVGDPTGFDRYAATVKRLTSAETRISKLERTTAATTAVQVAAIAALATVADTGWVNLSIVTDWGAGTVGKPAQYRTINGITYLRGEIFRTGASMALAANTGYSIASGIAAGSTLTYNWNFLVPSTVTQLIEIEVTTAGGLTLRSRTGAATAATNFWISLAGISWTID